MVAFTGRKKQKLISDEQSIRCNVSGWACICVHLCQNLGVHVGARIPEQTYDIWVTFAWICGPPAPGLSWDQTLSWSLMLCQP